MKKIPFVIAFLLVATFVRCQDVNKLINEDYVRTVVTTLAADEMMGRSPATPKHTNKAIDFIASQFKEIGLEPLQGLNGFKQEFSHKTWPNVTMCNLVGVLKGRSKQDEIVVFGAHYDHIGIVDKIEGDSIANGADDDASGTTAVIALAKYFKAMNNNERTLIFVTFSAEEIGGVGSQTFTDSINPDKVVAMFNIEMIGKHSKWGTDAAFITGFERSNFGEILQKNVAGTKFKFYPDPYPEQELFYRSDNARLAMKGVPAHSISTDEIDKDQLYHTVNDEVESLDIRNMTEVIRGIALGSRSIVAGADTPTRIPPLEQRKK